MSDKGFDVTVSIPDGEALARQTFNPRLGIEGGLSILGTSGRVVPFSHEALTDSLACALDVAIAAGHTDPVFTPGNIGLKAAEVWLSPKEGQMVEVSNEWDFMLDLAVEKRVRKLLAFGHPGKLAKLAMGHFNTHSKKSPMATDFVRGLAEKLTGRKIDAANTVEGVFQSLSDRERMDLAEQLSQKVAAAISERVQYAFSVSVGLIDMKRNFLGGFGDLEHWK